jgi:hypothetical protein
MESHNQNKAERNNQNVDEKLLLKGKAKIKVLIIP